MFFFGSTMKMPYLCGRFQSKIALNINARKDNPEWKSLCKGSFRTVLTKIELHD